MRDIEEGGNFSSLMAAFEGGVLVLRWSQIRSDAKKQLFEPSRDWWRHPIGTPVGVILLLAFALDVQYKGLGEDFLFKGYALFGGVMWSWAWYARDAEDERLHLGSLLGSAIGGGLLIQGLAALCAALLALALVLLGVDSIIGISRP